MTRGDCFLQKKWMFKNKHCSSMSSNAWCDLKIKDDILKLHDKCPNSKCNCQKVITFTPNQFQLEGNGFKNTIKKIFKGSETAWNKFLKPALIIASPYTGMAVSAKTKNPRVGQGTAINLKSISGGKLLNLTYLHGIGLRLKVMWFNFIYSLYNKRDDLRKCSKSKTLSSKTKIYKDISTKNGLIPICEICRRGYFNEKFDKSIVYRKHYERNREESDLNIKLACDLRSRTSKAFKAQNVRKRKKTIDLLGCSHSFFKSWIIHQLYGNMTSEKYCSKWQTDHCLAVASFNLLDEMEVKKCFNWINLQPMYLKDNTIKGDKIDLRLYLLAETKANDFMELNVEGG